VQQPLPRENEIAGWLRLALLPGLGPSLQRQLLARYGTPDRVFARPRAELGAIVARESIQALDSTHLEGEVARAMRWLETPGSALLTLADAQYPALLLQTPDPPAVLFCRGRLELLARPCLAIVGSRNATAQGSRDAERLAKAFSDAGLAVVSGLALGIDAAAHRGALAGSGGTIAVLGTGVDVAYPHANVSLHARISHEGLLVSEFALGSRPLAHHFPRRNRLISGLSRGCLVVEAALASGSLITARLALEQGRDVFAVPGSIHSPLSKGCHALIREGAKLVESAQDVISELGLGAAPSPARDDPAPSRAEPLLDQMGADPVDVDSLCSRSGLAPAAVSEALLRLELAGKVAVLPGGLYQRIY
jgi:DNA processing protein